MAHEEIIRPLTMRGNSTAFALSQYRMVIQSSSDGVFTAGSTVAGKVAIGVLQDAPTISGEPALVATYGSVCKLKFATTTVVAGSNFKMGAVGRAVSTGTVAAGDQIYGPVMSSVSSSCEIGTVMFQPLYATT